MTPHGLDLPDGWGLEGSADRFLVAERRLLPALVAHGLEHPAGWEQRLAATSSSAGRGGSARVELAAGVVARIKPLLRGGIAARVRPDSFADLSRPLANVRLPLEAARRGLRTPEPLALLCRRCRAGWRAWLALREIDGGEDLGQALSRHGASTIDFDAVTEAIRAAHDAGLEHRDLNVGNLLLVPPTGTACSVWLLDLDRARLSPQPLPFRCRQRALRRLERSLEKTRAAGAATPTLRDRLYRSYAADDEGLAARLERGRPVGRALIRLHALGWRRGS